MLILGDYLSHLNRGLLELILLYLLLDCQPISDVAVSLVPLLASTIYAELHQAAVHPQGCLLPYRQHPQGQLDTSLTLVLSGCMSAPLASAILLWLHATVLGSALLRRLLDLLWLDG